MGKMKPRSSEAVLKKLVDGHCGFSITLSVSTLIIYHPWKRVSDGDIIRETTIEWREIEL